MPARVHRRDIPHLFLFPYCLITMNFFSSQLTVLFYQPLSAKCDRKSFEAARSEDISRISLFLHDVLSKLHGVPPPLELLAAARAVLVAYE